MVGVDRGEGGPCQRESRDPETCPTRTTDLCKEKTKGASRTSRVESGREEILQKGLREGPSSVEEGKRHGGRVVAGELERRRRSSRRNDEGSWPEGGRGPVVWTTNETKDGEGDETGTD